ncbi:MAG: hypothetical protein KatS3mg115_1486 [Candidatus Poribacteria bacterium]|nr:MAG: hypothetical protein KatS3mg115_1486 [Candidatus Poribacteria bacterium]
MLSPMSTRRSARAREQPRDRCPAWRWAVGLILLLGGCAGLRPEPAVPKLRLEPAFGSSQGGEQLLLRADRVLFQGAVTVLFGDQPARVEGTPDGGRSLSLRTPPGPAGERVPVTLILNPGTRQERRYLLRDAYRYIPPPVVSEISPSAVAAEMPGSVSLIGSGLPPDAVLEIGGEEVAEVHHVGTQLITAPLPALPAGRYPVALVVRDQTGQRRYPVGQIAYMLPLVRYRLGIAYQWIDLRSRRVLSAGLIRVSKDLDRREEVPRGRIFETLVQEMVERLQLPGLDRSADRLWLVYWDGQPWVTPPPVEPGDAILLLTSTATALRGRGLQVDEKLRGNQKLDSSLLEGYAFGTLPLNPGAIRSLLSRPTKLLLCRILTLDRIDLRAAYLDPGEEQATTPTPLDRWTEQFQNVRELIERLPVPPDVAVLPVRLPSESSEGTIGPRRADPRGGHPERPGRAGPSSGQASWAGGQAPLDSEGR